MALTGNKSDRRRHTRFKVCEGAFAFINNIPYAIRNISHGGLRLETVFCGDEELDEISLDIFLRDENLYLQDIPVRLVNVWKDYPHSPFSAMGVRCLGLQFADLTEQQLTRLDLFMSRSTTGVA